MKPDWDSILKIFQDDAAMLDRYNTNPESLEVLFELIIQDYGLTGDPNLLKLLGAIPDEFDPDYIYEMDHNFLIGLKQSPPDQIGTRLETWMNRALNQNNEYWMASWDQIQYKEFLRQLEPPSASERHPAWLYYQTHVSE